MLKQTMKQPCKGCPLENTNKNSLECVNCAARLEYVASVQEDDQIEIITQPTPTDRGAPSIEGRGERQTKDYTGENIMEKEVETRQCNKCGETKPLLPEHWIKNPSYKGGFEGICRKCRTLRTNALRKAKAEDKDKTLELNFTDHPDMLARIEQLAVAAIRTPQQQTLYLLQSILSDDMSGASA